MISLNPHSAICLCIGLGILNGCKDSRPPILPIEQIDINSRPPLSVQDAKSAGYSTPQDIQFWRALNNLSSASSLVVINFINTNNGKTQACCLGAGELLDLIAKEHNLKMYESHNQIIKLAMLTRETGFKFKNTKNLSRYISYYTTDDLNWAIGIVSKFNNQELVAGFTDNTESGFEMKLLGDRPGNKHYLRLAIAHAIYLRGLNVGLNCLAPTLWVSE